MGQEPGCRVDHVIPPDPRRPLRRWGLVAVAMLSIATFLTAAQEFGWLTHFNRPEVEGLIRHLGVWAPAGFVGLFALVVLVSLPSSVMTLVGGALFGFWGGLVLNAVGAIAGAVMAFGAARRWGRDRLEARLHPRLAGLSAQMADSGLFCMFFLRFAGIFPFSAVNYTAGISRIRFRDYLLGTAAGMLPGMAVYTYLGASLTTFRPGPIALGFGALAVLSALGWWWQRQRKAANCLPQPGAVTFVDEPVKSRRR